MPKIIYYWNPFRNLPDTENEEQMALNIVLVKTVFAVLEVTINAAIEYTKKLKQTPEIAIIEVELEAIESALEFISQNIDSAKQSLDAPKKD